jgi:hypothetical protein
VAGHSPRPGRMLLGYSLTVFPSGGGDGEPRELLLFSASRYYGWMDRWIDGSIDRLMDGWIDRWMDG